MDSIIKSVLDPSWWFSGTFFIVVPWLLTKAFRRLQPKLQGILKEQKIQHLRRMRALRWDPLEITQLIASPNANYAIFVGLIVLFLYLIILTPLREVLKSPLFTIMLASPIYFFQFRWLIPDTLAKEAIKSRRLIGRRRAVIASDKKKAAKRKAHGKAVL